MKQKTKIIFNKIINYANETIEFSIEAYTLQDFQNNRKTIAACVFNISQIGELVKVLDKEVIEKYSHIYWHGIRGLRNRIVHDYEGLDIPAIWEVIREDIPQLMIDLNLILESEK